MGRKPDPDDCISMIWKLIAAFLLLASAALIAMAQTRLGTAPAGARGVSVTAADKAVLRAWSIRPASPNGNCVVVLHGIADSSMGSAGFAPMFLESGYSVLLPRTASQGESAAAAPEEFRQRVLGWFAAHS